MRAGPSMIADKEALRQPELSMYRSTDGSSLLPRLRRTVAGFARPSFQPPVVTRWLAGCHGDRGWWFLPRPPQFTTTKNKTKKCNIFTLSQK